MLVDNNSQIRAKEILDKMKQYKVKIAQNPKLNKKKSSEHKESLEELKLRIEELKSLAKISEFKFKHEHHGKFGSLFRNLITKILKKLSSPIIIPQEQFNQRVIDTLDSFYKVLEEEKN